MASVLTTWLEDNIHIQLHLARQWLQDKAVRRQQSTKLDPHREWAGVYEDNGSCIDVVDNIHPEHNSNLHIIQKYPLTLTDGTALIEAKLTRECRQHLYTRYGTRRSLTSPNSVIAVRKYTIRYTAYGPRRDQLSFILEIVDWKGQGAERSFAGLQPIASCDQVTKALHELREARLEEDRRCFLSDLGAEGEDTMARGVNRGDEDGVGRVSSPSTQMAYGTQLPHQFRTRPDDDVQFLGIHRKEPILAGNTRREELRSNTAASNLTKQAELLSLLNRSRAHDAGAPPVPSTVGFARAAASRESDVVSRSPVSVNKQGHVRCEPLDEPRPMPPPVRRNGMDSVAMDGNGGEQSVLRSEVDVEPHPILDSPPHAPLSGESEENDVDDPEPDWLQGFRPSRASAKVPSRQRSLLAKPECWQKPAPGHRVPDANIPIEILEALKEHTEMSAEDEASSPSSSQDQDDELPVVEDGEGADAGLATSEVSWSRSPTPEPPRRPFRTELGLPPDSSLENGKDGMDGHDVPFQNTPAQKDQQPIVIESSNEQMVLDPPSSPPLIQAGDDSDAEMELDVPRGLGEDRSPSEELSVPVHARPATVVQVKETPYAKGNSGITVPSANPPAPARKQTSSGTSKDTSSTSIIYGTYNEPNSSGDDDAGKIGAAMAPPLSAPVVLNGIENSVGDAFHHAEVDPAVHAPKQVHFPSADNNDVFMEDVPLNTPRTPKSSAPLRGGAEATVEDQDMPLVQPEPTPMSAQLPRPDLSSLGEQAPPPAQASNGTQPEPTRPADVQAPIPTPDHVKRKFDNSPSKKSNRRSKRREIKLVGFGDDSPVRDTAVEIRRLRKELMDRYREERRSDASFADSLSNERRDSVPNTRSHHVQGGVEVRTAETPKQLLREKEGPVRKDEQLENRSSQGLIRQTRSPAGKPTSRVLPVGDRSTSSTQQKGQPFATEMDVDRSTKEQDRDQVSIPSAHNHPSNGSPGQLRAPNASSTVQKDQTPGASMHVSTQASNRPETIFQNFKAAYPEYTGDTQHFTGQCKQMYKLDLEDKMVPKWQWDDFIIRNRTDYKDYALECMDRGEDAEPYYRFYKDNIRDTLYRNGIIESRDALRTALEELGAKPPAASFAAKPTISTPRRGSFDKPAAPNPSTVKSNRNPTSTPRKSFAGSAFNRSGTGTGPAQRIPTEPTGDAYRDFVFGFQRMTSLTGSTMIDPKKNWPANLSVRPVAEVKRRRHDVLDWKDEL